MSVSKVFRARTSPEAIDLVSRLLEYTPSARITPLQVLTTFFLTLLSLAPNYSIVKRRKCSEEKYYQACAHTFFDELREPGTKLPSGRELPVLFNFTEQVNRNTPWNLLKTFFFLQELKIQPSLNSQLVPAHLQVNEYFLF